MKKVILTVVLFIGTIASTFAQLNAAATTMQTYMPDSYESIKVFAQNEWKGDQPMIVYTINEQSISLMEFMDLFSSQKTEERKRICLIALNEWTCVESYDYFANSTTDWSMVVYKVLNELQALDSY